MLFEAIKIFISYWWLYYLLFGVLLIGYAMFK